MYLYRKIANPRMSVVDEEKRYNKAVRAIFRAGKLYFWGLNLIRIDLSNNLCDIRQLEAD